MTREQKVKKDQETVRRYQKRMERERKVYTRASKTFSATDRKSRALAAGACMLSLYEDIRLLNSQKKLIPGTLYYTFDETKLIDTDKRKGFEYTATYYVKADECAYDKETIQKELHDLWEKLKMETEELYRDDEAEDPIPQEESGK